MKKSWKIPIDDLPKTHAVLNRMVTLFTAGVLQELRQYCSSEELAVPDKGK